MSFADKVILVTGGSSGIGADCAKNFAKKSAKVAIVGRNEKRLNEIVKQIVDTGSPTPLPIVADVTTDAQRIIDETIKHFGKLDILINSAGYLIQDNISKHFDINKFDEIFDTNLRSAIRLTHLAVPYLNESKGNIVNVSSVAGVNAFANTLSYNISKAALNQFTKCCAIDLSPNIRVNAINPGHIKTHLYDGLGLSSNELDELFKVYAPQYLVGRIGDVSDTSAAIEFLASERAAFITGALLPVDGGIMTSGLRLDSKQINSKQL